MSAFFLDCSTYFSKGPSSGTFFRFFSDGAGLDFDFRRNSVLPGFSNISKDVLEYVCYQDTYN